MPEDVSVEFNPAYLESILINLITNCLKYRHPERALKISISAKRSHKRTKLSVADNGLGIDMSIHGSRLFGMYNTFHKHPDARGLGLFMVKSQVESMGGEITAQSVPGSGTTFTIELDSN